MIGTKIYKKDFDSSSYFEAANWCNEFNKDNSSKVTISDKGLYYEVISIVESIEDVRSSKLSSLKSSRDKAEVLAVTTEKGSFDFDDKSRNRLEIAYKYLSSNDSTIDWTLSDNSIVSVTAADINNVFLAAASRSSELHNRYRTLREEVNAYTTVEDIKSITF